MQIKFVLLLVFCSMQFFSVHAQVGISKDTLATVKAQDSILVDDYKPLRPAQVAFYSAVLPGLGQAYNKDYWKVPIVYAALGTGVGVAVFNQKEFQRYRSAYKDRIAGRIDEFTTVADNGELTEVFSDAALLDAQTFYRKRKDLSILVTVGIYILQIVEANVKAHLSQFNVDDRLSVNPFFERDENSPSNTFGANLTFSF